MNAPKSSMTQDALLAPAMKALRRLYDRLYLRTAGRMRWVADVSRCVRRCLVGTVARVLGASEVGLYRLRIARTACRPSARPSDDAVVASSNGEPRGLPGLAGRSRTVVLDGCAFQFDGGGVKRFWGAMMEEWSRNGFARCVVVLDRGGTAPRYPGFRYRPVPRLRVNNTAAQRALLEAVCAREGADLFVSTYYTHPMRCPSLLYVYDMTPEVLGWDLDLPVWREKREAISYASAYAVASGSTMRDLHRLCPETGDRPVVVDYPAAVSAFHQASVAEVENLRVRLALPQRYVLFIGHREGYKNAALLFGALAELGQVPDFGVLLVGGRAVLEPHLARLVPGMPVRIASLSDEDLRAAYSGAVALVYVSRYEGFGMPILEAKACGCPVITCRNSSLPEAAGPDTLFVDESDSAHLVNTLQGLLDGDRSKWTERGFDWAARFTWVRTARVLEDAIVSACVAGGESQDLRV